MTELLFLADSLSLWHLTTETESKNMLQRSNVQTKRKENVASK